MSIKIVEGGIDVATIKPAFEGKNVGRQLLGKEFIDGVGKDDAAPGREKVVEDRGEAVDRGPRIGIIELETRTGNDVKGAEMMRRSPVEEPDATFVAVPRGQGQRSSMSIGHRRSGRPTQSEGLGTDAAAENDGRCT